MSELDLLIEYGKVLKKYRKSLNLSQEKFALKIGMDRTYYASVESGKRNISFHNIIKISEGLEVKTSDIFKEIEEL